MYTYIHQYKCIYTSIKRPFTCRSRFWRVTVPWSQVFFLVLFSRHFQWRVWVEFLEHLDMLCMCVCVCVCVCACVCVKERERERERKRKTERERGKRERERERVFERQGLEKLDPDSTLKMTGKRDSVPLHTCALRRLGVVQHIATYCNILHHVKLHCTALQLNTRHSISVLCGILVSCNSLQLTATHCNTLQRTATHSIPML